MAENQALPMTQAEASDLARAVADAIESVRHRFVAHRNHPPATVERELEHILRREAVARAPKTTP